MATSKLSYLEESRPPENLNNNTQHRAELRQTMGAFDVSNELPLAAQYLTSSDINRNPSTDINSNRVDTTQQCDIGPRVLKSNSYREQRRPVSAPERKRNSYHCDVEEALSSLLWQPYEYQGNRSDSSDTLSSTLSSSSSEYLSWLNRYDNIADPNPSLQMVTNLMPVRVGATVSQPQTVSQSHDQRVSAKVGSATDRLSQSRGTEDLRSRCAVECRDYEVISVLGDMRLEIGGILGENKPENETTTESRLFNSISTDMIPSNMTSVVSANVVGLPVAHSRSSSNISNRNTEISQHPRSASEVLVLRSSNNLSDKQFRSTTNISHARQTSGVNRGSSEPPSTNPVNITHVSESRSVQNLVPDDNNEDTRIPPLPNVSNVNVNFYRAVPVNVVCSVPTINCINSTEETGNNVSNVHIVQAMPATIPTVSVSQITVKPETRTRTFTSTEAQTDDTSVGNIVPQTSTRERRRRERRERRHQRRINQTNHQHITPPPNQYTQNERLPDILNSHLPPPYTTLPPGTQVTTPVVTPVAAPVGPPPGAILPYQVPLVPGQPQAIPVAAPTGFRFSFPTAAGFRR